MRPAKGRRFTTLLLTVLMVCGRFGRIETEIALQDRENVTAVVIIPA